MAQKKQLFMVIRIRKLRKYCLCRVRIIHILHILISRTESLGFTKCQQNYLYGNSETFGDSKEKWRDIIWAIDLQY